jgi:selenocysteine lyase/cysteine desulfurase
MARHDIRKPGPGAVEKQGSRPASQEVTMSVSSRTPFPVSRRRFLGGSAAALGGLSLGLPDVLQAQMRQAAAGSGGLNAGVSLDRFRPQGVPDEAYWKALRREFDFVDELIYMNNGTMGPIPRPVVDANIRYLREIAADPRNSFGGLMEETRTKLAAFVGADADEIALTNSTTEGVKLFALGVDLAAGDEVLMSTHEHGGGRGPWTLREQRHKVKINTVAIPAPPESVDQVVSLVDKAFTPRTKILLVSYPIYVTGLLMPIKPLADLAHKRGALISVDGAHALGMMDLNMHAFGVDHFATAGQKWLMSGTGNGLAYFKRDIQARVWGELATANEDPKAGARKYERGGNKNVPATLGMGVAADFQSAIGKKAVQDRIHFLATRLKTGLKGIAGANVHTSGSDEMSGGLTTFSVGTVPKANVIRAAMEREGVHITQSGLNAGSCRVSTHIYTSPADVDRLLDVVRYIAQNASKFTSAV